VTALTDIFREDYRERVVLVEIDYMAEIAGAPEVRTLYYSSSVKTTQGRQGDLTAGLGSPTGPPVIYEDALNSVPSFSRALSGPVSSTFSSSLGSIEIDNADGDKDAVLALALDGSQCRFYLWDAGTKYLVFTALALRASAPSFDRISIMLKDSGELLNKSVGGTDLIGGTGPNADQWRPINFGYVHNLEAKVYDASALQYVHSDTGTFTSAVEVRDRGVSVSYTDNADGTFTLDAAPAGIITCDVVASYDGTDPTRRVSDVMQFLVGDRLANNSGQGFDGAGSTFTIGDDDDYLIGISIAEARNIVDVLNQITDSGNCFWAIKRTGEFFYGRLRPNNIADFGFTTATITEDDYVQGSWKIDHDSPLYYLLQAYMSRNWTQQTDFAGVLTPDEQAVFTRPGIFLLQDAAVGTAYADIPEAYHKTLSISPAIDTLLSGGFDELDLPYLAAWMETRRFMQLPWIERLSMTVGMEFYFLELGDPVEVVTPRYGLDGGDLFQVISINVNLTKSEIELVLMRRHLAEPLPPGWTRVTASIDFVPPLRALRPLINPPPPGPGGSGAPPCGWLYSVARGWYFVPCGGGGGGSPGSVQTYNFRYGGAFATDWVVPENYFDVDQFNSPVWYDFSGTQILVHEDVADNATGNTGATVDIPLLPDASHGIGGGYSTPDFYNLPFPASMNDFGSVSGVGILFSDFSTKVADGSVIDYTINPGTVLGLRYSVPAGPYSPGTDVTIGQMEGQTWVDHDYGQGTPTPTSFVAIDATILGGLANAYSFTDAQMLLTIQNNSGSTLTAMDDGVGGFVEINLPSNAADPDAPVDGELDASFKLDGGSLPYCTINNASGATLTIAGDRRTLQFKFTGASIADGTKASFVFPITLVKGGDDGWLGYTQRGDDQSRPTPSFNGAFDVTPSATIKLMTGSEGVIFLANN